MKNIILILMLTIAITLPAQWTQTSGPGGGEILSIAGSGNYIFAGTSRSGVYRSADNGGNWVAVNNGLTEKRIEKITVSGANIFVLSYGKIFRSLNYGDTWISINASTMYNNDIKDINLIGSKIIVGTNGGIFVTTDNGNNWTSANTGLSSTDISSIFVRDATVYAGTWGGGVFVSTDNCSSWEPINTGLTNLHVRTLSAKGSNLYAGTNGNGIFAYSNNGNNWSEINEGLPSNTSVNNLVINDSVFFLRTTNSGFYISTNSGSLWTKVNTDQINLIVSFSAHKNNLLIGTYCGIYISTDNGANWANASIGISNTLVKSLLYYDDILYAGAYWDGVFYSQDEGYSWVPINNGLSIRVNALAAKDTILIAGGEGGLCRSTNGGASWSNVSNGIVGGWVYALTYCRDYLFAGTGSGIRRSADNGISWVGANNGFTTADVNAFAVKDNIIFAGATIYGVYKSENYGANWVAVNNGLPSTYNSVHSLAFSGNHLYAGTNSGIYRSDNLGASWTKVSSYFVRTLLCTPDGKNVFAGTRDGIILSTDDGNSWTAVNTGLTSCNPYALASSGLNLFTGGLEYAGNNNGLGVWKRPLSQMVSIEDNEELAIRNEELSNYPNPFNNTTAIRYQLPKAAEVELSAYNNKGELVRQLFAGQQNSGSHTATFDATGLNSGVYYIRLKYGNTTKTHKVLLVK